MSKASERPAPKTKAPSLTEFMREKARKGCIICALPLEVRMQLGKPATERGFTRPDQAEWLRQACGVTGVTLDILNKHLSSRHDREEDLNG